MTGLLNLPLHDLKGIGEKTEKLFNKMGVYTVGDILLFFPRDYISYPEIISIKDLEQDQKQAVLGLLSRPVINKYLKNISIQTALIENEDSAVDAIWYRMPYLRSNLKCNIPYVFYGNIRAKGDRLRFEQPIVFSPEDYKALVNSPAPVYSTTKGLSQKTIRKVVMSALSDKASISDNLPISLIKKRNLMPYMDAVRAMHKPSDFDELIRARNRFAYEELLQFFLEVKSEENNIDISKNKFDLSKREIFDRCIEALPFRLTEGQSNALSDIIADFKGDIITERLIQGDVGCGKTVIAFLAMVFMAENGYQSSLMAPTEVLANQHYESFRQYIEDFKLPFKAEILTGSMKKSDKKKALQRIESGEVDFVIGTHALIQDDIVFKNLSLAITDEQHRFGVKQRKILMEKGQEPFSILLSATPIPRTLALILYNGMNVSLIKELPKDRLPIKTAVIAESIRIKAWQMLAKELYQGRQAYVVCPLVEESENMEAENVTDYKEKLQDAIGNNFKIEILHGKMKSSDKDKIMEDFKAGLIHVVVSTTVIEVGVNVPNATVMIIENAERFGLSSLHQLRGRVGRGKYQSYCILVNGASKDNNKATERLNVLHDSNDGFVIAEKDLTLRGPGDFRGIRQSGDMAFTIADIYQDARLLEEASSDAETILKNDPDLLNEENKYLKILREREKEKVYTNM